MGNIVVKLLRSGLTNYKKQKDIRFLFRRIKGKYLKLQSNRSLSREQEAEIKQYYKDKLGIDITLIWHRYYYRRTGVFSPRFIPTFLFNTELLGRANQMQLHKAYQDKNLADRIITGIKHPETILKNMNGYWYIDNIPVSENQALKSCWNISDVIIKPSCSYHGNNVQKISVHDGITSNDGISIQELFRQYGSNFIVQKAIKQHEALSALNPTSINTIRILTYRSEMEILILYTVIRIGRLGWIIDNESAGGMSARINTDGTLAKYAVSKPGEDSIEKTDTNIILEGYKIPSYDEAMESVKRAHLQVPFFNIVGWDIAIDFDGNPILVEWNTFPGLSQSANRGPAFGEYTERIFKELWGRPNTMY